MSFLPAMISPRASKLAAALIFTATGCSGSPTPTDAADVVSDATDTSVDTATADTVTGPRCQATTPTCQDQSIQRLPLFATVNPAAITPVSATSGVFVSEVNTVAGGITPTQSFVYARFTDTGLEKVSISDEDSLVSLDWDIAFRRFVIRLNSGVSGPSCVDAAQTASGTDFTAITAAPSGLTYTTEAYFDSACAFVPESSGLGSPGTVLSSFWHYPRSCVEMTGAVYVVRLRDGRQVKLQVMSYYSPVTAQDECNSTGSTTGTGGHVRIQWALLGS